MSDGTFRGKIKSHTVPGDTRLNYVHPSSHCGHGGQEGEGKNAINFLRPREMRWNANELSHKRHTRNFERGGEEIRGSKNVSSFRLSSSPGRHPHWISEWLLFRDSRGEFQSQVDQKNCSIGGVRAAGGTEGPPMEYLGKNQPLGSLTLNPSSPLE